MIEDKETKHDTKEETRNKRECKERESNTTIIKRSSLRIHKRKST